MVTKWCVRPPFYSEISRIALMALLRDLRLPLVLTGDELIRSRAPDPMRVAHSAPDLVDIRGRDALRPPLLVGVAIVVCVALALIAIPETHTVPRLEGW